MLEESIDPALKWFEQACKNAGGTVKWRTESFKTSKETRVTCYFSEGMEPYISTELIDEKDFLVLSLCIGGYSKYKCKRIRNPTIASISSTYPPKNLKGIVDIHVNKHLDRYSSRLTFGKEDKVKKMNLTLIETSGGDKIYRVELEQEEV